MATHLLARAKDFVVEKQNHDYDWQQISLVINIYKFIYIYIYIWAEPILPQPPWFCVPSVIRKPSSLPVQLAGGRCTTSPRLPSFDPSCWFFRWSFSSRYSCRRPAGSPSAARCQPLLWTPGEAPEAAPDQLWWLHVSGDRDLDNERSLERCHYCTKWIRWDVVISLVKLYFRACIILSGFSLCSFENWRNETFTSIPFMLTIHIYIYIYIYIRHTGNYMI